MRGAAVATQRAVWMKKHSPSAMSKGSGTCQTFVPRVVAERLKPVTLFSQQADADGAPDGLRWGGIILTSNTSKRRLTGGSRSLECDLLCGVWRTCSHAHFSCSSTSTFENWTSRFKSVMRTSEICRNPSSFLQTGARGRLEKHKNGKPIAYVKLLRKGADRANTQVVHAPHREEHFAPIRDLRGGKLASGKTTE